MEQVLAATGGNATVRGPQEFDGVSTDTRTIAKGLLFVPLKGEKYDGHDFIEKALETGASGFLYEEKVLDKQNVINMAENFNAACISVNDTLYALGELARSGRKRFKDLKVAAITGSAGKSTTKEMAASILAQSSTVLKNEGNLNNRIGLPLTLLQLNDGIDVAVVEFGTNEPGEIARLSEIASPRVGCVTNVGAAHLEGLGNEEGVAREKGALPEALTGECTFVANFEDDRVMEMAARTAARVIGFGVDIETKGLSPLSPRLAENYVTTRNLRVGVETSTFDLVTPDGEAHVELTIPGRHNVLNALAATAVASAMERTLEEIVKGLKDFEALKWRTQVRKLADGVKVIEDCYNSNPVSARAAIGLLISGSSRSIAVLGEMLELGDATEKEHTLIGAEAGRRGVEILIALGEHADCTIEGFKRENASGIALKADSVESAAEMVIENLKPGDIILLKASRGLRLEGAYPIIQKFWESGKKIIEGEGA